MRRRPVVEPPTEARKRRIGDVEKEYEQFLNTALGICSVRELKKTLREMGGGSGLSQRAEIVQKLVEVSRIDW